MAGAIRVGHTMAAAMTSTRVLEPVEAHIALLGGALLLCLALVAWFVPRVLTYPMIAIAVWFGLALTYRAWTLCPEASPVVVAGVLTPMQTVPRNARG